MKKCTPIYFDVRRNKNTWLGKSYVQVFNSAKMFSLDKSCRKLGWRDFISKWRGFCQHQLFFLGRSIITIITFYFSLHFIHMQKTEKMWFRNAHFKLVIFVSTQYFRIFRVNLKILWCESLLDQVDCRYIPTCRSPHSTTAAFILLVHCPFMEYLDLSKIAWQK